MPRTRPKTKVTRKRKTRALATSAPKRRPAAAGTAKTGTSLPRSPARPSIPRALELLEEEIRAPLQPELPLADDASPEAIDADVLEALNETQTLVDEDPNHVFTDKSAVLSGGDVDAAWDQADVGEEAVGGSNPTPDQDIVDQIGRSLGLEYEDDEELKGAAKLEERDKHRWELDPASSEDYEDR